MVLKCNLSLLNYKMLTKTYTIKENSHKPHKIWILIKKKNKRKIKKRIIPIFNNLKTMLKNYYNHKMINYHKLQKRKVRKENQLKNKLIILKNLKNSLRKTYQKSIHRNKSKNLFKKKNNLDNLNNRLELHKHKLDNHNNK